MVATLDTYFEVENIIQLPDSVVFNVRLNPYCPIYEGHFPARHIAPGVCQIEMIRKCAEQICGKRLIINYLKQCKFLKLITPDTHSHLKIILNVSPAENIYHVKADIIDNDNELCVNLTAEMTPQTFNEN
ncbi:MAG: hypothetical protein LBR36_06275 [Bacteroidales bacterium]|jgi:3-hydroxyacyl-[acyl-carrier-protein] dehydratase|nr:hypothetical protein [Bacteroidales bacterium]